MKKSIYFVWLITASLLSCNDTQQEPISQYSLLEILEENATPTVDIATYTLITDTGVDRTKDAREIMTIKRKWPLAMQSLNPAAFDSILSTDFTFKSDNTFFNREEYIKNRTTPDVWKITFVEYDNVSLQFFENTAVLSYKNHVRNENTVTKEVEMEHMSWVDIYVKELQEWKLGASHAIDYRLEVVSDTDNMN